MSVTHTKKLNCNKHAIKKTSLRAKNESYTFSLTKEKKYANKALAKSEAFFLNI